MYRCVCIGQNLGQSGNEAMREGKVPISAPAHTVGCLCNSLTIGYQREIIGGPHIERENGASDCFAHSLPVCASGPKHGFRMCLKPLPTVCAYRLFSAGALGSYNFPKK